MFVYVYMCVHTNNILTRVHFGLYRIIPVYSIVNNKHGNAVGRLTRFINIIVS
jgi:hypothetical protein